MRKLADAVPDIELTSSAPAALTPEMRQLAADLSAIHGLVRVTREAHGVHFYLASPACLAEDGAVELHKCHLAINVTKYMEGHTRAALCHKTDTSYDVMDLLFMRPLSERGYDTKAKVVEAAALDERLMDKDHMGRLIPKGPGEVVPVTGLPADHPAIQYLTSRKFDPQALHAQFRLSYCVKERPDVYYRRLAGGFAATPQGRLIFYIDVEGVNRGWQARILEATTPDEKFYYHPYKEEWVPMEDRNPSGEGKPWRPKPQFPDWDPVKYMIGAGARRNSCLLGLDPAFAHACQHPDARGRRWCFLVEGPLDAGRLGPPAVAMMGKHFSDEQADLVAKHFSRVIFIADNDAAGASALAKVRYQLQVRLEGSVALEVMPLPPGRKDAGELSKEEVAVFHYLAKKGTK
jgi:hypothetical protein